MPLTKITSEFSVPRENTIAFPFREISNP